MHIIGQGLAIMTLKENIGHYTPCVTSPPLRLLASNRRGRSGRIRISYRQLNVYIVIETGVMRRFFHRKRSGTRLVLGKNGKKV